MSLVTVGTLVTLSWDISIPTVEANPVLPHYTPDNTEIIIHTPDKLIKRTDYDIVVQPEYGAAGQILKRFTVETLGNYKFKLMFNDSEDFKLISTLSVKVIDLNSLVRTTIPPDLYGIL